MEPMFRFINLKTHAYLYINRGGIFHHSLHYRSDVSRFNGVHPISRFHALPQHLRYDQSLNLDHNKIKSTQHNNLPIILKEA